MRALPLLATCLLASAASAQNFDIVISEVLYDPAGPDAGLERIELWNRDVQEANLFGWSLAVCYPGSLIDNRTYWPFGSNFKIPPDGRVTIHYLESGIDTNEEFYTGPDANFICVTPAKNMDNSAGSVALFNTTNCSLFSSFTTIVDFVQWGDKTHHDVQAHMAGIWSTGTWIPDVGEGSSIAYIGEGDTPADWWEDSSPTLTLVNEYPGLASLNYMGTGCAGTPGIPVLETFGGPPALGNQSFHLWVQNALAGAPVVVAMAGSPGATPLFGCTVEIDLTTLILVLPSKTVDPAGEAAFALPVPDDWGLLGVPLYFQAAVVDPGSPSGIVAFSTTVEAGI